MLPSSPHTVVAAENLSMIQTQALVLVQGEHTASFKAHLELSTTISLRTTIR